MCTRGKYRFKLVQICKTRVIIKEDSLFEIRGGFSFKNIK